MDEFSENQNDDTQLESLEDESATQPSGSAPAAPSSPSSSPDSPPSASGSIDTTPAAPSPSPSGRGPSVIRRFLQRFKHVNIYLLAFVVVLVLAAGVSGFLYLHSKQSSSSSVTKLSSQSLSSSSLSQLANSGVNVGDPKQVLTVQSNSIFTGQVLVRGDLEVAGRLLVGNSLSLTGINVSGQSQFDDVQVTKDLAITGNAGIQGKLSIRNLAASGDGNFSGTVTAGQLAANSLQLNSDLILTHHLVVGGTTPGRSNGGALGAGGTSTVGGSDTAGSISINTGSSPAAGCFITVNFAQRYNSTPRVLVTPVGSAAASVNYYVTKTTSGFSVCGASAAPAGQSFGFDYFVAG